MRTTRRSERGQASPEWLGILLLVSLAVAAALATGVRLPGTGLAEAVLERLVCAVDLGQSCAESEPTLTSVYGPELAKLVMANVPNLLYEKGMRAVPVDFRSCREDACAEGSSEAEVTESLTGEPVTLFTHVVDCRAPESFEGFDCSGDRDGNLYLQFWAYYPGSQTSRALLGERGFHPDDWESYSVRISPDSVNARASSHHGYNGKRGNPANDVVGLASSWTEANGLYEISGGSHAGRVGGGNLITGPYRVTEAGEVRVIPLEALERIWDEYEFEVVPPWLKPVWRDPESTKT